MALRAKLDDERLAHDEATLAFASGLNQHEMDMRNNPQKYANMKLEESKVFRSFPHLMGVLSRI